jgi:hypothetical protein
MGTSDSEISTETMTNSRLPAGSGMPRNSWPSAVPPVWVMK